MLARHLGKWLFHGLDEPDERQVAFGEIANLCTPVAHLEVDVVVIIACPGGVNLVVPDSLQVDGQIAGAGTTDEHVATVLIDGGLELGIRAAVLVRADAFVCGELGYRGIGFAEFETKALIQ